MRRIGTRVIMTTLPYSAYSAIMLSFLADENGWGDANKTQILERNGTHRLKRELGILKRCKGRQYRKIRAKDQKVEEEHHPSVESLYDTYYY
jgi:hypothetical protein